MIPARERCILDELVTCLRELLGDDLVGVYLHGSAAFGCFGPRSDLDVLAVSRRPVTDEERGVLMARTNPTLEFHLLVEEDMRQWRHPLPFDFHEGRRGLDHDLAAHVTVARFCGIALCGPPPTDVLPKVPAGDYADAVRRDVEWALGRHRDKPLYLTLTLPRAWATLSTGAVFSKQSAADWALPRLPAELRPVLERALVVYRGEGEECWSSLPLDAYVAYVAGQIARLG